jgi:predicted ATPase
MEIRTFRVLNYKSFREPAEITLQPGFNLITGRNSIGKTAILEALSLFIGSNPHRSQRTVPTANHSPSPNSIVDMSIRIGNEDLWTLLASNPGDYYIPLPGKDVAIRRQFDVGHWGDQGALEKFVNWFRVLPHYDLPFRFDATSGSFTSEPFPSFGAYPVPRTGFWAYLVYSTQGQLRYEERADRPSLAAQTAPMLRARIYRFLAERLKIGRYQYGDNTNLNPDAGNLPEVLNALQSNHARFREFVSLVREILPQVRDISIVPRGGANEIMVWNIDPESKRLDLATPLQASGTGIGQVLAILYIVLTSTYGRPILIDEPQSFLHPGAARKLIEVLKRYSNHQFIIATHSPTIISAADSNEIICLKSKDDIETDFEVINARQASWAESVLDELGVRLSDVFGADNIIWVEGATEERCFPKILLKLTDLQLMGTNLLAVRRTGDLEGQDAERIVEIYAKLSKSNALIPPAIAFVFDREARTEQQQKELKTKSDKLVEFLPRRMYENYLLNSKAIAAVIKGIVNFSPQQITETQVEAFFEKHRGDAKYYDRIYPYQADTWKTNVHAARLLGDLFSEFSETRVVFLKLRYGVQLTDWILDNSPEELREIANVLKHMLAKPTTAAAASSKA